MLFRFELNTQKRVCYISLSFLYRMSCLHIWFSKLKWSMDVLLRFYERHAFICALHKETRLLFDELIFCLQVSSVNQIITYINNVLLIPTTTSSIFFHTSRLFTFQRLYSVPSTLRIDLPFGTDADFTLDDVYNHPIGQIGSTSHQSTTPTTTFASSQASSNGGVMSRSGGFAAFSGGCSNVSFT